MSAEIFGKFDMLQRGESVDICDAELERVSLRDFIDIAADTGLIIQVERLARGWFRLVVS